jgi:hypothetical protein
MKITNDGWVREVPDGRSWGMGISRRLLAEGGPEALDRARVNSTLLYKHLEVLWDLGDWLNTDPAKAAQLDAIAYAVELVKLQILSGNEGPDIRYRSS